MLCVLRKRSRANKPKSKCSLFGRSRLRVADADFDMRHVVVVSTLLSILFLRHSASNECETVTPIWNKITGKPEVKLKDAKLLSVSWTKRSILHGEDCAQAFAVEWQHFGHGRRTWTPWSGLAGCAVVLNRRNRAKLKFACKKRLDDFDCGRRQRFRVILHNVLHVNGSSSVPSVYEEIYVQCKYDRR